MDNSLIDCLLVIWFLVTAIYICFWSIGNGINDKIKDQDLREKARGIIIFCEIVLIFLSIWIIFLFITTGIKSETIISLLFSTVAILLSIALFFINKSQNQNNIESDK